LARVVHETGFRKSTVYESIKRLQEKGLVSYVVKDAKKYFEAADPDKLLDFVQDRKRVFDEYEKEVHKILPELKKGFTVTKPHAEAHVLVGIEGFKTMRRDALRNAGKEHLLLGSISREHEVIPGFFNSWNTSRLVKGIHLRILHKESTREKAMASWKFMEKNFETRFLPKEIESPAVVNIYGNRVVNVVWKGNHPICFMLINKDIADSYRQYFNYLWKMAKK
jgi:sugar-specific transcriptional regulator TrmB